MGTTSQAIRTRSEALSNEEREFAARYLTAARDRLLEATKGLTEAQWKFEPAGDRWSIAEIMEHIVIVEGRVQELVGKMDQAPEDAADRDVKQVDAFVLAVTPMRHPGVKAPERLEPLAGRAGAESLAQFLRQRERIAELVSRAQNLRGRVMPHPIFGPWDGYQWLLATGGHCLRHTDQILEVKMDPNYPAS